MTDPPSVTDLLRATRGSSDSTGVDRVMPVVYRELKAIAHRQLSRERPSHTLGTTGLVHEAYLKLVDQSRADWQDRAHFFAVAARVMRRVLVDYARRRGASKRGAGRRAVPLDTVELSLPQRAELVVALDEALERLARLDDRQSRVVEYRYFGGLTEEETATLLGVTSRTVRNDWVKAKGWLLRELSSSE